jgi:hypothetical protein
MKKIISAFGRFSENQLIAFITAISILVTLRVIYIQHGWINNDSVLYFEVARLFAAGQWKEGLSLYNWPLYPALLALLHNLSSFSIQHVAQLLNVIFFAITTYSFLTLIRLAGGNKTTMVCGTLLLLSSTYIVGDVLPMLLRDQGFWAFFLASLGFFIRFYRSGKLSEAVLWQLCAILATLFRIEAVTFLILLPLSIISNPSVTSRAVINRIFAASIITLACAGVILIVLLLVPSIRLTDLGRIQDIGAVLQNSYLQITHGLIEKSEIMDRLILGNYLDGYGLMGVVFTLIGIVLFKLAGTAGWGTIAILAVAGKDRPERLSPDAAKIFYWVIALALLNTVVIILSTFVLSSRYIIALAFILMILASFSLAAFLRYLSSGRNKKDSARKWLLIALLLILVLSFLKNILPNGTTFNYQQNAAYWLKSNAGKNSQIFIDNPRIRYYAGEPYAGRSKDEWQLVLEAIQDKSIHHYDYLLISLDDEHPEREKYLTDILINHRLVKKFHKDGSGKAVLVYVKK